MKQQKNLSFLCANPFKVIKQTPSLSDHLVINDKKNLQEFKFSHTPFTSGKNNLRIMGYDLAFWQENFSLPLNLHYLPIIEENIKAYRNVFNDYYTKGKIRFAVKSSITLPVLKLIKNLNEGVETGSSYETCYALLAGIAAKNIVVTGNCKEDFFIEELITRDILLVADSFDEFKQIAAIADKLHKKAKTLIRLSGFSIKDVTAKSMFTSGVWSKFGLPLNDLPAFINNLNHYPSIDLMGFHVHIGSQITQVEPYLLILGKLVEYGLLLKEKIGSCRVIDIGGGFPVSYLDNKKWQELHIKIRDGYLAAKANDNSKAFLWDNSSGPFTQDTSGKIDFSTWKEERFYTPYPKALMLKKILTSKILVNGKNISALKALKLLDDPDFIIEPGRSIMEESGITLSKVGYVNKTALGHNVVAIETGITANSRSLLRPVYQEWRIANAINVKDPSPFSTFIVGNLCMNADILAKMKITLPRQPKRGDIMLLCNNGSYSSSFFESSPNGYPLPKRAFITKDGTIKLLTKKNLFS